MRRTNRKIQAQNSLGAIGKVETEAMCGSQVKRGEIKDKFQLNARFAEGIH